MTFALQITDDQEVLVEAPGGPGELPWGSMSHGARLPLLGLTRNCTRALHGLHNVIGSVSGDLAYDYILHLYKDFVNDTLSSIQCFEAEAADVITPYRSESDFITGTLSEDAQNDYTWLLLEYAALRDAVTLWLTPAPRYGGKPKYLTPKERFIQTSEQDPDQDLRLSLLKHVPELLDDQDNKYRGNLMLDVYREEVFRYRTRQVGAEVYVTRSGGQETLAHLYHADGLLSLMWMEVLWAVENGQHAATCQICGGAFTLKGPYERKAYLCSESCKRLHTKLRTIKAAGGVEELRRQNRERKRQSRKRLSKGQRLRNRGFGITEG